MNFYSSRFSRNIDRALKISAYIFIAVLMLSSAAAAANMKLKSDLRKLSKRNDELRRNGRITEHIEKRDSVNELESAVKRAEDSVKEEKKEEEAGKEILDMAEQLVEREHRGDFEIEKLVLTDRIELFIKYSDYDTLMSSIDLLSEGWDMRFKEMSEGEIEKTAELEFIRKEGD